MNRVYYKIYTGNRLTSVTMFDGRKFTCQYDAKGNLTKISDSLTGDIEMTYNANKRMTKIIYSGGNFIADETSASDRRYYHADGLASTRILTNASGVSIKMNIIKLQKKGG